MYAVIQDGGREFRVEPEDIVEVDFRSDRKQGDEIVFDRVLLVRRSETEVLVGTPVVPGAEVHGTVQGAVRGEKLTIYNYKRRKGYHRKKGHRQPFTRVKITGIKA
ncbi:MAG: 50S ribosomal protein L21 [Planctomycetes bacterium]|jgi:large subunit ribosomal protein L21|nr:50S ribosomal protein L21 [Planctomycetota bacterium]